MLDAETWSNVAAVAAGIAVDAETIALETIAAVGIGGNALGQKHTRRHMKRRLAAAPLRPQRLRRLAARGPARARRQRAAELAAALCAGHEVPPLDAEKRATLRRIIATAGL